jgi:TPR repeat protein
VRWYRRSAHQGNDLAQRKLDLLYEGGDGVPKDYVQAYMWYKLEAANGGTSGAIMRNDLAIRMTSDQLSEAKKLAREWKPKNK